MGARALEHAVLRGRLADKGVVYSMGAKVSKRVVAAISELSMMRGRR